MLKEIRCHYRSYLVLIVGLGVGVFLFLGGWPNLRFQRIVAVGIAIYYVLWGVLAHLNEDRINSKVVLEYVAVGSLAGLLLILVTF